MFSEGRSAVIVKNDGSKLLLYLYSLMDRTWILSRSKITLKDLFLHWAMIYSVKKCHCLIIV